MSASAPIGMPGEPDICALLGCGAPPEVVVNHRGRPDESETYLCEFHGRRALADCATHLRDVN